MTEEPKGTIAELMALLGRGGRWWMAPIVFGGIIVGGAALFFHALEYVAPFVYVSPQ